MNDPQNARQKIEFSNDFSTGVVLCGPEGGEPTT